MTAVEQVRACRTCRRPLAVGETVLAEDFRVLDPDLPGALVRVRTEYECLACGEPEVTP